MIDCFKQVEFDCKRVADLVCIDDWSIQNGDLKPRLLLWCSAAVKYGNRHAAKDLSVRDEMYRTKLAIELEASVPDLEKVAMLLKSGSLSQSSLFFLFRPAIID